MQSKIKFLPLAMLIALSHIAFSEEGEIFQSYGVCRIEMADGTLKKIPCNKKVDDYMGVFEKAEIVRSLESFQQSEELKLVNQASFEMKENVMSKTDMVAKYSSEILQKAAKVAENQYLVKIIYANDGGYPLKSSSNNKYYVSSERTFEWLGEAEEAEWDNTIATKYIGSNYRNYQTSVDVITKDNVIITVTLDDSSQLSGLIDDNKVRSIDHVGTPLLEYEEIIPLGYQEITPNHSEQ